MATRPVFISSDVYPFFKEIIVSFEWNGGFSLTQKRKNIHNLHSSYGSDKRILEVSRRSEDQLGIDLSAFNLMKYVKSLDKAVSVECIFQSSKKFTNGGPYLDLLDKSSKEAKTDERLKTSGELISFNFEGEDYPLIPKTVFYDYIYINALMEKPELLNEISEYDGFTDIEFNPNKSLNCQARSCAIAKSIYLLGLKDKCKEFKSFMELITNGK